MQLAHFGPASHESVAAEWTLTTADWAGDSDAVIADGTLPAADVPQGELVDLGAVEVGFGNALENADVDAPVRLTLSVSVAATDAATDYDVWVYPADLPAVGADSESFGGSADAPVTVSRAFDEETRESLESGEDVILVPRHDDVRHSVKSAFAPCFWSYALFKRNAPLGRWARSATPTTPCSTTSRRRLTATGSGGTSSRTPARSYWTTRRTSSNR
ncbi:hypothetical protein ACFQL4_19890 [Halosimplex aquaticum]